MIYLHRGLSQCDFFNEAEIDIDALTYLSLATQVAREVRPGAIVIAEEVSGWPALCRPHADGGIGFTHRLAMAIPDLWIKYLKHKRDEDWDMGEIVYELTNRPAGQLSVAYAGKLLYFIIIIILFCFYVSFILFLFYFYFRLLLFVVFRAFFLKKFVP